MAKSRATRLLSGLLLSFLFAVPAAAREAFVERSLTVSVPGAEMSGTALDTPAGAVVLFLSGSGPTDRNGNSRLTQNDAMRLLAEGLGARGFASLRFDKRFSGDTTLASRDEAQITLDTYANDAGFWLNAARERYPGRPVLPLGHSEVGVVALRLAQRAAVDGLILVAAPGRTMDTIVLEQMAAGGATPETIDTLRGALTRLRDDQPVGEVPPTLHALLRPGVYPFWRSMLAFDPPTALAALRGPVLLIYGGRDLQVSTIDMGLLVAARPDAASRVFPTMNHVLRAAPPDRPGNIALYRTPKVPLEDGLVDAIADFLARQ